MYEPNLNSSLMEVANSKEFSYGDRLLGNMSLRHGAVVEEFPIDDDRNVSKLSTEYTVMVVQYNKGNAASVIYKNVIAFDGFGSVADFFEFKKRTPEDSKKTQRSGSLKNQLGSIALVMCLDGSSEKAVILGFLPHPSRKTKLSKDVFAAGELNGISYQVNEDGGFSLKFKGKTKSDGKPVDEKVGGSNFTVAKDGSVTISDNGKEGIKFDQTAKTTTISSEKDFSINSGANFNVTATAAGNITVKDLIAKCSGSANIETATGLTLKAGGDLTVSAATFKFTSDGDIMVKGSNMIVDSPSISLGAGGLPALVLSTFFIGIGNLGAPVLSAPIGPFSSTVRISL